MRDDGKDNKKDRKRPKLNKEQKLKKQVEELQEQAQIDLEGYVTCRSALRAVRQELVDEEKKLERVKADYHEMKERHAPLKYLSAEYRRVRRIKRHVRDLTKAKKKTAPGYEGTSRWSQEKDGHQYICSCVICSHDHDDTVETQAVVIWSVLSGNVCCRAAIGSYHGRRVQTAFESGVYRVWIVRYMAVDTGVVYEEKGLAWHIEAIC